MSQRLEDRNARPGGEHRSTPAAFEIDWRRPKAISDDEIADFVVGQYKAGKGRRTAWERRAAEQLAWARGDQDVAWDEEGRDLALIAREHLPLELRDPVQINRLRGFVLAYLSFVIGQPIEWMVFAETRDDDDLAAARLGEKLLRYFWGVGDTDTATRMIEMLWHVACTGVAWLKPIWDPFRGTADRFTPEILREPGETTEATKQRKLLVGRWRQFVEKINPNAKASPDDALDLPAGDVYLDYATGFEITEPEGTYTVEDCPWLIDSRYRRIEYVRERYGIAGKEVQPDAEDQEHPEQRYLRYGERRHSSGEVADERVLVHELWRPRSHSAPLGFFGVVAYGKVLRKGAHPYLHGRLPFIQVRETPDPEDIRGNCTLGDLMSPQRARNDLRSYCLGHLKTTCDPRILYEKGMELPEDAFTTGPKQIPVRNVDGVKAFESSRLPDYAFGLDQQFDSDMDAIAGVHRSTTGRAESGQQSGRHAALMMQQDARRQSIARQLIEGAFGSAGSQMLWLAWEFVRADRTTKIPGETGAHDVIKWKGADLVGGSSSPKERIPGPFAFNVKARLGVQRDETTTVTLIDALTSLGVLDAQDPTHRRLILRWLGEQVPDQLDPHEIHRAGARAENDEIAARKLVRTALGDDDQVHVEIHEAFTLTGEYRSAVRRKPDVHEIMRTHIREHHLQYADKKLRPAAIIKFTEGLLAAQYALSKPPPPVVAQGQPGAPGPVGPQRGNGQGQGTGGVAMPGRSRMAGPVI